MESYKMGAGIKQWKDGKAYEVTFIVTEDCNLRCSYCYQVHKNNKHKMSFDTAKKVVDYLLDNPELYDAEGVVWDFIGGEPLLEIDLIDRIVDYIKIKSYKIGHKWAKNYRINIGTNGTLYGQPNVRRFVKKNKGKLQIGITIDGTKRKHDMHRVYLNGKGSYDDVFKNIPLWLEEFPDSTTKVTFGSEDLKYLKESIVHLWSNGISVIPANVVFEDVWKPGDEIIFEEQLIELADYIIDNKIWNKVNCTFFEDGLGVPNDDSVINSNYCGTGRMLAVDAKGNFYPCLRFSDFTLCEKKGIPIGNVDEGIDYEKVRPFLALSTKAISNEECLNCEVSSGCGWCQGCNYDCETEDTIYSRATYICKMHKARVRANNYYWGRLRRETGIVNPASGKERKHMYFIMSDDSIECCDYKSGDSVGNIMSLEIAKKGLEFCEKNFYRPVILNSKSKDNIYNLDQLSMLSRIEVCKNSAELPYKNFDKYVVLEPKDINKFEGNKIVIVNINEEYFTRLAEVVISLLPVSQRVNIVFKFDFTKKYLDIYEQQLNEICQEIIRYLKMGTFKEVNVITDRLFLKKMNNCNGGVDNYALAPDGKIYICPAFYYKTPQYAIGDIENGITNTKLSKMFDLKHAPVCQRCDAYQCNRCVMKNKTDTREYNTPGSLQCIKSHIERNVAMHMLEKLKEENIKYGADISIEPVKYKEPMEKIINELSVNPYATHNC